MQYKCFAAITAAFVAMSTASAQNDSSFKSENGAVTLYTDGGITFGVPAVRASVSIAGAGSAISPQKKVLPSVGFGVSVRAWKTLVPFADFNLIDTGKATARLGPGMSVAQASTYSFNSGLRLIARSSRFRPYVQVGGGLIRQDLKATFTAGNASVSQSAAGSVGSLVYGAGAQLFIGRKWGTTLGFDGYHLASPMNGAGQNYGSFRVGFFLQTKSSVQ